MENPIKIENKPTYCSAWISKISKKVMCNTIPCCGFSIHGQKDKISQGFLGKNKIGAHPLVDGRFQFNDGTFHDPNFVRKHVLVTETEYEYKGKKYKFSNKNLKVGDKVFPISDGFISDNKKYYHEKFDFRDFMCGFPDEPHTIIDLEYSKEKSYQVRTDYGYSPIECYFKIIN